jgi:hypothetical protein
VSSRLVRASLLLAAAVLLSSCPAQRSDEPAATPAAASPAPATAPAASPDVSPQLPAGGIEVALTEHGVTVRAHQAPRHEVLKKLGEAARFAVVSGLVKQEIVLVSVDVVDRPVEEAIRAVMQQSPYELRYDLDPKDRTRHVLSVVTMGNFKTVYGRRRREFVQRARQKNEQRKREEAALTPEERERRRAEKKAALQRLAEQTNRDLDSEDPEVRAAAVANLRAEEDDLTRMAELLTRDPSAGVRVEAADQLGAIGTPGAINALLRSLADPEPDVVIAALEALRFAGDESIVPDLQSLRQHPDPQVRAAVEQTIEFLQ